MKTTNLLKITTIFLFFISLLGANMLFAQNRIWKHTNGSFREQPHTKIIEWVEYIKGNASFNFVELVSNEQNTILLKDDSRKCRVKLTATACFVSFNGEPYKKYYTGKWSSNKGFEDEGGPQINTVYVAPKKTAEELENLDLQNKKTALEIAEIERKRKADEEARLNEQNRLRAEAEERRKQQIAEQKAKEEAERKAKEEAEKQRIADDVKRVKEEDKAVGGANTRLKNGLIGNNFEMVKKAINEKADPSAVFENGENTLFFCLSNAKILDLLIEKGADVTQKRDLDGKTPLHLVETLEAATSLARYSRDINIPDNNKQTSLESAIQRNKSDIALYLIEKGANVNTNNGTPLSLACGMNNTPIQMEVIRRLISKGAKVDQAPDKFNYPLHLAAQLDNYDLASLLLEKGADADRRDGDYKKAKSYAKNKTIKTLLKD